MGNSGHCGPISRYLERAEAVVRFPVTTRHDFLGVYLHWLGVAAIEDCPLCGQARMDGDHLLKCAGLDEYPTDNIVSQRLGVKWSSSQARTLDK
ncbi:reverse transcriptase [Trichonephila clavipes]|nr:reverse transcriptase [Trichonephila clavipes]